jgi:hypothetical protein
LGIAKGAVGYYDLLTADRFLTGAVDIDGDDALASVIPLPFGPSLPRLPKAPDMIMSC